MVNECAPSSLFFQLEVGVPIYAPNLGAFFVFTPQRAVSVPPNTFLAFGAQNLFQLPGSGLDIFVESLRWLWLKGSLGTHFRFRSTRSSISERMRVSTERTQKPPAEKPKRIMAACSICSIVSVILRVFFDELVAHLHEFHPTCEFDFAEMLDVSASVGGAVRASFPRSTDPEVATVPLCSSFVCHKLFRSPFVEPVLTTPHKVFLDGLPLEGVGLTACPRVKGLKHRRG